MLVFSLFVVKVELHWVKRCCGWITSFFKMSPETKKGEDPGG